MRGEFNLDLVVVDPEASLFRGPRRGREQNQQDQSQGTGEDAQAAPQVNQHSGDSPGNDNPFPMMKILTQKMLGAQGLEGVMSGFCHFENSVAGSVQLRCLSFRAQRGTWVCAAAGKNPGPS